ncbi:MAG: hypothetical protein ACLP50_11860 [Solirubrobacteraceae bacterium]
MATSVVDALPGQLEPVAAAAAQRLRAQAAGDEPQAAQAQQALVAAASAAMAAGVDLAQIAAAEQTGQARVRDELGKDTLRAVERAARRRREIETEYQDTIRRAGRLGLPHRDVASAAGAAPGTIRSLLTRPANGTPTSTHDKPPAEHHDSE